MKRLFAVIVLVVMLALYGAVHAASWLKPYAGVVVGVPMAALPSTATLTLNASNTWLALGFMADDNKTLSKVKAYTSAIAGTQSNITITATLYASTTAGIPDSGSAALDGPRSVTNLAAGWWEWTGWTYSLKAGTQYWLVFKNTASVPATDYPTFLYGAGESMSRVLNSGDTGIGYAKVHTTDAGTAWATSALHSIFGMRLEFSDSTFAGAPFSNATISTSKSYGAKVVGSLFTTPANPSLIVKAAGVFLRKTSSPTGDMSLRLYSGSTLLGETSKINAANATSGIVYVLPFSSPITLSTSTAYRLVVKNSAADDVSNYYTTYEYTVENNVNSLAMVPLGMQKTYTDDDTAGTISWTDVQTNVPCLWLVLDTDGFFGASSGGSGGSYAF